MKVYLDGKLLDGVWSLSQEPTKSQGYLQPAGAEDEKGLLVTIHYGRGGTQYSGEIICREVEASRTGSIFIKGVKDARLGIKEEKQ